MIKTLILLCATSLAPSECTEDTARAVLQGPEVVVCGMMPQAYLSQTILGQELLEHEEYPKVTCKRERVSDPYDS
jgi:hypothetical protein